MILVRYNLTLINPTAEMFTFGDMEIEMVFRQNVGGTMSPLVSFGAAQYSSITYDNIYEVSLMPKDSTKMHLNVGNEYSGANQNTYTDTVGLVEVGKWHRIRVVRKGATYQAYVDGTQVLNVSFAANRLPTSFANPLGNGYQKLMIGSLYYGTGAVYIPNSSVDIMYLQIKNETGKPVYGMGSDPGGSPGVPSPMVFKGQVASDPYGTVQPRSANKSKGASIESAMYAKPRATWTTAKGTMFDEKEVSGFKRPLPKPGLLDYDPLKITGKVKPRGGVIEDPFYKTFVRGSQRGNAYILDMTGSGKNSGEAKEAVPPRAFPLESPWKKANPTSFNK